VNTEQCHYSRTDPFTTNVSIWGPGGSYVIPYRKTNFFRGELTVNNASGPVWASVTNLAALPNGTNAATLGSVAGNVFVPQTPEHFFHDADGNLTNDGRWTYTWDAENRLVAMTNHTSVGPALGLSFAYDWRGRRIGKTVITNGLVATSEAFVYDGWNLLAILNSNSSLLTSFTWGLDLSGSDQGAGGVGGLLAVHDTVSGAHFAAFEGNGNVAGLVSATGGTNSAQYEYGPFGELIRATGPMAKENPFRFSTKYQDDETDLHYYGYRYYNASTGRWITTDPLGDVQFVQQQMSGKSEREQVQLAVESLTPSYVSLLNSPLTSIDPLGLDRWFLVGFPPLPHAAIVVEEWDVRCCKVTGYWLYSFGPKWPLGSGPIPVLSCAGEVTRQTVAKPQDAPTVYWPGGFRDLPYLPDHHVSSCQADKQLKSWAESHYESPPPYKIIGYNCWDWATTAMGVGTQLDPPEAPVIDPYPLQPIM